MHYHYIALQDNPALEPLRNQVFLLPLWTLFVLFLGSFCSCTAVTHQHLSKWYDVICMQHFFHSFFSCMPKFCVCLINVHYLSLLFLSHFIMIVHFFNIVDLFCSNNTLCNQISHTIDSCLKLMIPPDSLNILDPSFPATKQLVSSLCQPANTYQI